jgi:uncharacterized protein YsxB (DUF464 family)
MKNIHIKQNNWINTTNNNQNYTLNTRDLSNSRNLIHFYTHFTSRSLHHIYTNYSTFIKLRKI